MNRRFVRPVTLVGLALVIGLSAQAGGGAGLVGAQAPPPTSVSSFPPDTNTYVRAPVAEDYGTTSAARAGAQIFSSPPPSPIGGLLRNLVVSNTNRELRGSDDRGDGEPSIAVNPANPNEIVITAFSGNWAGGANAPFWHSLDGGNTWTKRFNFPIPPGQLQTCPCDQTIDFGRGGRMSATFLAVSPPAGPPNLLNVISGTTSNPANPAGFQYFLVGGNAQFTNQAVVNNVDQPWLLVNRDNAVAAQDNVYVAYDDFTGGPDMRVAVAKGTNPPNFVVDAKSGVSTGFVNPGHRLAADPRNGTMYSLFQRRIAAGASGSQNIDFMLNRSTDGGVTWTLNGNPNGIAVANADSTQPTTKFGTVNALLGGVLHAAVDPNNGDVYYIHGSRDAVTGANRLRVVRLVTDGGGTMTVASASFLTGQVQAALPSIAVAANGVIGVLYDTFDGLSPLEGWPRFSIHFAQSADQGLTWSDGVLYSFLSPAKDNGDPRQRVLGDYQQVKAVGNTFFGTFTGNGFAFGRSISNPDPIFFNLPATGSVPRRER
ncbi:MAG: sialidase family protein [Dehalococcoidia bacterium]